MPLLPCQQQVHKVERLRLCSCGQTLCRVLAQTQASSTESILKMLVQTLRKNGVERYAPKEGDAFDADLHNAMFDVPAPPTGGQGMDPGRVAMLIKVCWCWFSLHLRR